MSRALRLALLLIVFGCAYLLLTHPYWFPAGASASSVPIDYQFKIAFWVFGALFIVSHLVGDYLFQTDWQARNKTFGLGSDPVARRALFSHVLIYTLAFVPAVV